MPGAPGLSYDQVDQHDIGKQFFVRPPEAQDIQLVTAWINWLMVAALGIEPKTFWL